VSHFKQVGMSCKNTRFIKRGLTCGEVQRVERVNKADRDRWNELMAQPWNKWRLYSENKSTAKSNKP